MASNGECSQRRKQILAALEQYESRLIRYAARILGDPDAARDAVQQTFLKLCDHHDSVPAERQAAWLYTVCRNAAVDILRRNGRAERSAGEDLPESAGRERDPASIAEQDDVYAGLQVLVARLPAGQREAIDLWVDGFNYRDIARITNRSEGAIRVLVHRALASLRNEPWTRALLMQPDATNDPTGRARQPDSSTTACQPDSSLQEK